MIIYSDTYNTGNSLADFYEEVLPCSKCNENNDCCDVCGGTGSIVDRY